MADIGKRFSLLMSKVSSLKVLKRKSSMNVLLAAFGQIQGQAPIMEEAAIWTGDKTVEEIIMAEEPYTYQVRCSQLSPFMKKYATKHFTPHDIVVPNRLPDTVTLKGMPGLDPRHGTLEDMIAASKPKPQTKQGAVATGSVRRYRGRAGSMEDPQMVRYNEPAGQMPCLCGKCLGEFWRRHHVPERFVRKMTDYTSHDNNKKVVVKSRLRRYDPTAVTVEYHYPSQQTSVSPEQRLHENTVFNEMYGSTISDRLVQLRGEKLKQADDFRGFEEETQKERQQRLDRNSPIKKRDENGGEQTERLPEIQPKVKMSDGQRKMRLMSTIKKLEARYVDKRGREDARRSVKEREDRKKFTLEMKRNNSVWDRGLRDASDRLMRYVYTK